MLLAAHVDRFRQLATDWLAPKGFKVEDVKLGTDAWLIAHNSGITDICYGNSAKDLPGVQGCTDAHIKTALARIFPNAVFKDRYRH